MRLVIVCSLLIVLAGLAHALNPALSPTVPAKAPGHTAAPAADPAMLRQGGDTIADAVLVTLPYGGSGTTAGYTDDYDEVCPYGDSTSPDVVYTCIPDADGGWDIDLLGSSYDTKVYVYDQDLSLVACNDDFYPDYVSKLENVLLLGGVQYFIVVDGYGGEAGDYVIDIIPFPDLPCVLDCPAGGFLEGEPPLQDDEDNDFNAGCSSASPGDPFQELHGDADGELVLCGGGGWFQSFGSDTRDTDWFVLTFGPDGVIELTGDAEEGLYMFELGPQECSNVAVVQDVLAGPCAPAAMTISGEPFATVWFWTGASTFSPPGGNPTPYEFDYVIEFSGLAPEPVATEARSWGEVKALFD